MSHRLSTLATVSLIICSLMVGGCGSDDSNTSTKTSKKVTTTTDDIQTLTDPGTQTTPTTATTPTTDGGDAKPQPQDADLTITFDEDGKGSKAAQTTTLECASEFLAESGPCRSLAEDPTVLDEPRDGKICTEQYGGPQTARVKGTLNGRPVDVSFSRTDGCEISRWDAARDIIESPKGGKNPLE